MSRNVICISRTAGAGGESVGRAVAEQLGFTYVDEDIIRVASEKAGVDAGMIAKAEERAPLLDRVLDALTMQGVATMVAASSGIPAFTAVEPPADDMRAFIRDAIREVAERGRVVIVAHAASYALHGREDLLRVLVTASPETRAERLRLLDAGDAAKAVRESDKERAQYLRRFYDVRSEEPVHYDLVLNTDALAVERVAAAIVAAAR